jgi:CDP-diacylglycerol--serine O-phosphatidyltransferase
MPSQEYSRTFFTETPLALAAWMIIWCVLLDKLDGLAAKLMNASSEFGAQFDSLADLIAFGMAPAFCAYFYLYNTNPQWVKSHLPVMVCSLLVYVLCTSMRLARYNAKDSEELGNYFHGLPSTTAGGFVAISIILIDKYQIISKHENLNYLIPLLLIILGALMISPLYLPKLVKRKKRWLNLIQTTGIVSGYIFGLLTKFPEYLFFILIVYISVGFSYCLIHRKDIELELVK